MRVLEKIKRYIRLFYTISDRLCSIQLALGRIESRQLTIEPFKSINSFEYKVYSQWGDDGLIQYLINNVDIDKTIFVEFGVENYTESNTRFLLENNNWTGLVIDGSEENTQFIKSDPIYWRYNLKVECGFIDKDNINQLIEKNGISGDIGLLSIDIDGNDYWVWKSIECVNPRIIICEYNSLWGSEHAVTIPYNPNFIRTEAHFSNLYYGASIKALTDLANIKGYKLVGSNRAGNNLFFVRNDLMGNLKVVSPSDAWRKSQFRESRGRNGELTALEFDKRLSEIKDLPLIKIDEDKQYNVSELYSCE